MTVPAGPQKPLLRLVQFEDLDDLVRLEQACWPESLRAPREVIRQRIATFSRGQLAAVLDGSVAGVIYSQRIPEVSALDEIDFQKVACLSTGRGPVLQLLALNVLPHFSNLGLGDQLLRRLLRDLAGNDGITRVVAVTRCREPHPSIPTERYIHMCDAHGLPLDPLLRFHRHHGAEIVRVLPGYRPQSAGRENRGVLIEYPTAPAAAEEWSRSALSNQEPEAIIEDAVRHMLKEGQSLSRHVPLLELGLGSLDLYGLATLLQQKLGIALDPAFFFNYPTVSDMVAHFTDSGRSDRAGTGNPAATFRPVDGNAIREISRPAHLEPEAVAVIGMACRFPGGVTGPDQFWSMLREARDVVSRVPVSRTPSHADTARGGFLEDVDSFDASFFGISPLEAASMDPRQRILLEVAWQALEHAAVDTDQLRGTRVGVFVGGFANDYEMLRAREQPIEQVDRYFGTGNDTSLLAGRLAYFFDFRGPALCVNTACSSSLTAVHMACRSLRAGECDLALAAGINLVLAPEMTRAFTRAGMLSPDGRCKAFSVSADGYVRSEGCGMVVLRRAGRARREFNPILALIRGSAINHDGFSNGLTAPNGEAQQAVMRQALHDAGVRPEEVTYVEAHGTGTRLGDLVEMKALASVYGGQDKRGRPVVIGSVKTNMGHTEATAGIAGLIKVILAMQHETIPPHLHCRQPHPDLALESIPAEIPTKNMPFPGNAQGRRFAAVSSFGFSGTNAHLIVAEPPQLEAARSTQRAGYLLTLSARNDAALQQLARAYADRPATVDDPANTCFTANRGRTHLPERLAVVAASGEDLRRQLAGLKKGDSAVGLIRGRAGSRVPRIAFLFSGQGSQLPRMGQTLYRDEPVFRRIMDRCDSLLRPCLEVPLLQALYPEGNDPGLLDQTTYAQPALFAFQTALAGLWQSRGIEPCLVLGHSVGELAAACIAGVFSLEDGLKLIAARGRLMGALPAGGGMLAVRADDAAVLEVAGLLKDDLSIAALNGPRSTVISGRNDTLEALSHRLRQANLAHIRLDVSHAFHSGLMEPVLDPFAEVAAEVAFHVPQLPLVSTVSGRPADPRITTAGYWVRHIRQPVRFADAIRQARDIDAFVEIGPKAVLLDLARDCLPGHKADRLPGSCGVNGEPLQLKRTLAMLYVRGAPVDWSAFEGNGGRFISLPGYPFQRRRFWFTAGQTSDGARPECAAPVETAADSNRNISNRVVPATKDLSGVPVMTSMNEVKSTPAAYRIAWQQQEPPQRLERSEEQHEGTWLIFADSGGLGRELAGLLRRRGRTCFLVLPDGAHIRRGSDEMVLPADARADELLRGLCHAGRPPGHIVHLRCLDLMETEPDPAEAAREACGLLFQLARGLTAQTNGPATRLWIVTRGAQVPDSALSIPAQGPIWGLGRVIALEATRNWGGLIDLDPRPRPAEAQAVLAEIRHAGHEDQIAFRNGKRYVPRLVPLPLPDRVIQLKPDSTYLLTGGSGFLARHLVAWMIERGARHILLTSRGSAADTEFQGSGFEGTNVVNLQADITNRVAIERVLIHIRDHMPPLAGIFHLAGIAAFQELRRTTEAELERAFAAKARGAWLLHTLTRGLPLDLFVCFSSAACIWGAEKQACYAAANHFLDSLVHYRRAVGLPGASINWGPFAGGMISKSEQEHLRRCGITSMTPEEGFAFLNALPGDDQQQAVVARVDWDRFRQVYEARRPRTLLSKLGRSIDIDEQEPVSGFHFRELPARVEPVIAWLQEKVASIMNLDSTSKPDPTRGFFAMGLDSLSIMELKKLIEVELDCSLSPTLILEHPTIEALANFLHARPNPRNKTSTVRLDPLVLEHMSEEEAETILIKKLEQLRSC
ncbi:MAG: type I polyketide synthase [Acidobacteriota bacterium]|nr:type I polyketide synthase [Acidobacteriota bacterium]